MPARKSAAPAEKAEAPMCDNHPEVEAVHTTSSALHSAISLCRACLRRFPHLAER